MAKYRKLIENERVPDLIEEPMVMAGKVDIAGHDLNGMYLLSVGPLGIYLTQGERQAIVDTWDRLDKRLLGA